jgi:Family of unknown function (DUF6171)
MSHLRKIAIGLLKGELPPLAEGELAGERLKVCEECPHFRHLARQCSLCSCFLDLKTKLLEATCPVEKW